MTTLLFLSKSNLRVLANLASTQIEVREMEVFTPKATRRSTRLRVEIPLVLTSMDRRHPFSAQCLALVVSPQGCGLRVPQALPLETPVLLADLPGGATASGRVASCLPVGTDGNLFLIGIALYNHGNVWAIADPPQDWNCGPAAKSTTTNSASKAASGDAAKASWPYNIFNAQGETRRTRK